MSLRWKASNP
jgi:hypothetical protein